MTTPGKCWIAVGVAIFLALPMAAADETTTVGSNLTNPASYRLGPGDILNISVYGVKDFDQIARVSNSGKIRIPHVGLLSVVDRTEPELEREIAKQLQDRGLLKAPWVQIKVLQYRAHPVYILGEVLMPGQFVITDEMRVMDLVSLSGGLNAVANPVAYLYRRRVATAEGAPTTMADDPVIDEAIPIQIRQLAEGKTPELNLELQGGDVLYIPQRKSETFFVVGDVVRSGGLTMPEGERILASRAISMAGGVLKTAKMNKGILVRTDAAGNRTERPVDFVAILRGKQQDFPIEPNDVIYIPGSTTKSIGYGIIGAIPNVATDAATVR